MNAAVDQHPAGQRRFDTRFEAGSQRHHHRVNVELRVGVHGEVYRATNWSEDGLRLEGFRESVEVGDVLPLNVHIPFQGFLMAFSVNARVRYVDAQSGAVGLQFIDLDERQLELLRYFSDNLLRGRMARVDETIRRVDIPVTPPSEQPDEPVALPDAGKKRKPPTLRMALLYGVVGLLLTALVVASIYASFFRLEVDTAVVRAQVEPIVAPDKGVVSAVYVAPGDRVARDEPLVRLANQELATRIEKARVALEELRLSRDALRASLEDGTQSLQVYRQLAEGKLEAARQKVDAARKRVALTRRDLQRKRALLADGVVTRAEVEAAELAHKSAQEALGVARAELKVAEAVTGAAAGGRYFSDKRQEFSIEQRRNELANMERRIALEEEKFKFLQQQRERLVLRAPYDGRVVQVPKSEGNLVAAGEPAVVLERAEIPQVHAYLTQQELLKVRKGSQATVYVPAIDRHLTATVVSIDTLPAIGHAGDVQFDQAGREARNGHVVLALRPEEVLRHAGDLSGGLPVIVNFERSTSSRLVNSLVALLRGGDGVPATPDRRPTLKARLDL